MFLAKLSSAVAPGQVVTTCRSHKSGSRCPSPGRPRMGSTSCTQPLVLQSLSEGPSRTQSLQQQEPAEPQKRRNSGKLDGFSKAFIRAGSWAGCHHVPGSRCPGPGCPSVGSTSCTQPLVLQSLSLSFSSTSDGNSWNHHGSSWQNLITRE